MRKWIYILILALCPVVCGQRHLVASDSNDISREEVLANHYSEQLECAHKYNNFATRTHSISIPTTNSSTTAAREQVRTSANAVLPTISARAVSIVFTVVELLITIYILCVVYDCDTQIYY